MQNLIFIISAISLIGISACKDCPEDIHFGNIKLMAASIQAISPYQNKSLATFINASNDTIRYDIIGFDTPVFVLTKLSILCSRKKTESFLRANCERTEGGLFFSGETPLNNIREFYCYLQIINLNSDNLLDTILFDQIRITSKANDGINYISQHPAHNRINIITSKRNKQIPAETSHLATDFFEELSLNGQIFEKVYKEDSAALIYYSLTKGISGFEDKNDVLWVLNSLD